MAVIEGLDDALWERLPLEDQIALLERRGIDYELRHTESPTKTAEPTAVPRVSATSSSTTKQAPTAPRAPAPSGGSGSGTAGGTSSTTSSAPATEAEAPLVQIMSGRDVVWYKVGGLYYAAYKLPNSNRRAVFEATASQMDAIFGKGIRPGAIQQPSLKGVIGQEGFTFSGNISEIAGEGSFENAVERGISLALEGGEIPEWARNSPEVWDIIYIAQAENKSDTWTLSQLEKTTAFQQRYVGIENFKSLGLDLSQSVQAYKEYESNLKQLTQRYGGLPQEITPTTVGSLLNRGHSVQDVKFVFDTFDRMEENQASLQAFNQILQARGMPTMGPSDQFAFMAGQAPEELYKVWEQTSILSAAQQAKVEGISANEAIELARRTPGLTSEEAALEGMQKASQLLLQFRQEVNLGKFDINQEDLIDMSLGLAPRSGQSQAQLAQSLQRAVKEAQGFLKPRARPFFGFNEEGRPEARSLGNLTRRSL